MDSGFEIRHIGEAKGVGLFATKAYKENDVILEEKPVVSCQFAWNESYSYLACHHCLRPLESAEENVRRLTGNIALVLPLPELCPTNKLTHTICDDCEVKFCSEQCKEEAVTRYHRTLCAKINPVMRLLKETWMGMHYPPETSTVMLIARMVAIIEQSDDKDKALSSFLQFDHSLSGQDETLVAKVLGQEGAENLQVLSSIMPSVFPGATYTKGLLTIDGLKTLFILIGKNGQGIGTSVFSEWVKKVEAAQISVESRNRIDNFINNAYDAMEERVGAFMNCEGSGLYSIQRCVNHNCDPNAVVTFPFSDHSLVLVAKKDILPGDEICTSYLDDCVINRSRHSRNKVLREYYLFECKCDKCLEQADDPDETSEDDDENEDDNEEVHNAGLDCNVVDDDDDDDDDDDEEEEEED